MAEASRFLVVEAYPEAARQELSAGGCSDASELYSRVLQRCAPGSLIDIVCGADPDASLPTAEQLQQYDGVVWTGSNLTIYQDVPEVSRQLELCRAVFQAGIPQFGSCWAAQIAVTAAGGRCAAHPDGIEFGIARNIRLNSDGRGHPLYSDKKAVFDAFISHYDEITHLPEGAKVLCSNDYTRVQAVTVSYRGGTFWSVQYHPEYDLHEFARLCFCRRQRLTDLGFFTSLQEADRFIDQLETLHREPGRRDIAWQLGISSDITNPDIRQREVRNWINQLVIPNKKKQAA